MTPYTRPQLIVLLVAIVVAGVGLGVRQWRDAYPELAARLERLDRTPVPFSPAIGDLPPATAPRRRTDPAPSRPVPSGARPAPARPLDLNRATVDELRALPGVGTVLAARIVETRERHGAFSSVDDLARVRGLTPARRARLAELATAGP